MCLCGQPHAPEFSQSVPCRWGNRSEPFGNLEPELCFRAATDPARYTHDSDVEFLCSTNIHLERMANMLKMSMKDEEGGRRASEVS